MRLGLNTGYSGGTVALPMELIREADRLGYYAVWTAEAYGSDAVSPWRGSARRPNGFSWAQRSCRWRPARRR